MILIASCPACGQHLAIGDRHPDGSTKSHPLKCSNKQCPRPLAALEILSEKQGKDHVVVVERNGFSVKHPLIERLDDALLHCDLAEHIAEFGEQYLRDAARETGHLEPGVAYRMWDNSHHTPSTPNGPEEWDYWVEWPTDDDGNAIPFEQETP